METIDREWLVGLIAERDRDEADSRYWDGRIDEYCLQNGIDVHELATVHAAWAANRHEGGFVLPLRVGIIPRATAR